MKTNDPRADLPVSVAQKLRAIRRRARTLTLLQGLALTGAVLIAAMLAAMGVDLAVGWFNPAARYTVTAFALAAVAVVAILSCARPLLRRRTITATARELEHAMPQLEERWSSVTEFAQSKDAPDVRGSESMIRKVASEADSASTAINPKTIVSARPAWNAGRWMLGAAAVLVVMLSINFAQARVLLHRFWKPGDNVSLTELHASPADTWVPKGEPLAIMASVHGRLPKEAPKLSIRHEATIAQEVSMAAVDGKEVGRFQHSLPDVADSFEYRVRDGDGQTPWHRITAVDRPEITAVKLTIKPPAYTHLEPEEKASLPNAVRVLRGSEVAVAFKSSQPLDKMLLDLGDGHSRQLTAAENDWYHCELSPTESLTFSALATNKFNLENKHKPSCTISVYEDLPPSVKVLSPSDEIAVTPTEKVNITFEAKDDFGLAKAEVIVTTTTAEGVQKTQTLPVDLKEDQGKKQVRESIELDPKALGLKHGDQLSYVVQVTDTKQNPAQASGSSPALASASPPKDQAPAAEKEEEKKKDNQAAPSNPSALLAKASPPSEEPKNGNGSQRPPDDMTRRMLDAGQCTACKPRNISIDEWAGTFEGEKRKKLEIAIAPVLEQLDQLLRIAEEKTGALQLALASPAGLQAAHEETLNDAKAKVGASEDVIGGFKNKTAGTPYAFVGLQLQNIGSAHITPAHRKLELAVIPASPPVSNLEPVNQANFHIQRAREMLADLTRTFEKVKRDQNIADAMQKLAKMHQLFIEDTQALLGNSKGPINSYNRKIAEVDEQFVEKLKAMLEEKKKILAELSKLLAEDPRLLRRFLAMQQLQCTTYRDQMTLLAERQKEIQQQLGKWNGTPEADRPALLPEMQASFAAPQRQIVQDAAALRENMETWLPLDVKPDEPKVAAALSQGEKIVQTIAGSTRTGTADEQAEAAVKQLRALRSSVSDLSAIGSKDKPRMTAYIANRLSEIETLINAQAHQGAIAAYLREGNFAKAAAVSQDAITSDTTTLGEKLTASGKQVARLSDEIAQKAAQLEKIVQSDILPPQGKSVAQLAEKNTGAAGESLDAVVPAFALGETTFDEMMRLIIAKLDEAPAPGAPGEAPQLDDIMAMLQNEMKACESLGIPCRPMNVTVVSDWMKPGNGQGMGQGQAQAKAAQAQSQQAKAEAERLEKQARASAQAALAAAKNPQPSPDETANDRAVNRAAGWNKLASKLQKDLLQGRDSTAPEQYRAAIENYFKAISEVPAPASK